VKTWQLQEAKAKFSEVVERAMGGEPQLVTKYGEKAVVVLDYEEYRRLEARRMSLLEALQAAPDMDELPIDRDKTPSREVDLGLFT
jgi:prevent-host-death family protein